MARCADCTRGLFRCRFERTLYPSTAPGLYLVLIGKDRVLPFMFTPVNGQTFVCLPAPCRPFATVKVACDLLPGFQSFLGGILVKHRKPSRRIYQRNIMPSLLESSRQEDAIA